MDSTMRMLGTLLIGLGLVTPVFAAQKITGQGPAPKGKDPGRISVSTELTEGECTRLGGTVTSDGKPNIPGCPTGLRCKTVGSNGDIHSICIDEVE